MIRGRRFLPSPALVVASIALLLALGGTAYAQFKLPRNSVSSIHVRDRSLLAKDFARNVLLRGPAGPTGPQGPQGPTGPAGATGPAGPSGATAVKWAVFSKDGQIVNQNSDIRFVAKPIGGSFIVNTGAPARGKAIVVSSSFAGGDTVARGTASASPCGGPPEGITCPVNNDINHIWVFTYSTTGAPEDHAFYLAILG
jgi:hypothetical protein